VISFIFLCHLECYSGARFMLVDCFAFVHP